MFRRAQQLVVDEKVPLLPAVVYRKGIAIFGLRLCFSRSFGWLWW